MQLKGGRRIVLVTRGGRPIAFVGLGPSDRYVVFLYRLSDPKDSDYDGKIGLVERFSGQFTDGWFLKDVAFGLAQQGVEAGFVINSNLYQIPPAVKGGLYFGLETLLKSGMIKNRLLEFFGERASKHLSATPSQLRFVKGRDAEGLAMLREVAAR
jgi:hypothetical protein